MKSNYPLDVRIKQARLSLLMNQPFFGNLIMQLPLVDATDQGWCATAAVDGRKIYYNRDFFDKLNIEELKFVLCHEILHVALDHLGRRSHRDPYWWNMANDYVINAMLTAEKIGEMPAAPVIDKNEKNNKNAQPQRVGLYDKKYHEWSSEAVYDDLQKRKVKKQLTLDVHLDLIGNKADGKKPGDKNLPGDIPGINLSPEELADLREEIRNKVLNAAAASAGKLPAALTRLIDDLIEPKIDWRTLILDTMQSQLTADFTWMRPNRKHMYGGVFLPSLKKEETIDVQIAIDLSGSISDAMAKDFLSEIKGIMEQYNDFKIGLLTFDTEPYNYREFTKDTMDELLSYKTKGGGGTDFDAFWSYYKKNNIEPKLVIVFTDGYPGGSWGPENYSDTVWVITEGAKTKVKPPFGRYAYYDHDDGIEKIDEA